MKNINELVLEATKQYKYLDLTYVAEGDKRWKINASKSKGENFVSTESTDTIEEGLLLLIDGHIQKNR